MYEPRLSEKSRFKSLYLKFVHDFVFAKKNPRKADSHNLGFCNTENLKAYLFFLECVFKIVFHQESQTSIYVNLDRS